jgi:hypothetical protein
MALTTSTVWELRPSVGNDTNGGGFDSTGTGTDYSQQNSKNSSGSNISTTDVVATGVATITSATAAFTSAIVGNIIYLVGTGITTGWYKVVTFTNSTTIILDRSPGTGTGVTMNIGGALATIGQAYTNAAAQACNIVYVKNTGNITVTSSLLVTYNSTAAPGNPLSFIGYTTTRGDNGQVVWTTATNSINLVQLNNAQNLLWQNFNFQTSAGTVAPGFYSGHSGGANSKLITFINCEFSGFTIAIEGNFAVDWAIEDLTLINCRVTGCTSHGIRNTDTTYLLGCILDNNSGAGYFFGGGSDPDGAVVAQNTIFYKNGANGLDTTNFSNPGTSFGSIILNNCAFSTNTGAGWKLQNTPQSSFASNCIFDANTTYGVDGNTGSTVVQPLMYNNAFYNNTTAATRACNAGIGTITLTASPYVSLASLNFALNTTAGGGALCANLGFPGALQFGGTGYATIGPLPVQGGVATVPLTLQVQDPLWYGV